MWFDTLKSASISILASLFLTLVLSPPIAGASTGTVTRLCEAVAARKQMIVDAEQPEVIWSDGAMFEVANEFSPALQELISAPSSQRNLKPIIGRFAEEQKADWKDATVSGSSRGGASRTVRSVDGSVSLTVSAAYIDYLQERYPNARIRVKSESQPVLFMVDEAVRGAVMPLRGPSE